jgi:uncharacterized damage-inducible protein DinB
MRRSFLILLAAASPLAAQQQQAAASANAAVTANKSVFQISHGYVLRAAEAVPESLYAFKAAPTVRSLGQLFGHVADAENMFCAAALGEAAPTTSIEQTKTAKADLIAALKASAAYCDKAYAQSDAAANGMTKLFGRDMSRMFALSLNAAHDFEHYGNIVTYMRIKGLVPPSSQQ